MATHGIRGSKYDRSGLGQWQRKKWSGDRRHDFGMVWICAVDHCHDWIVSHDLEYQDFGSVNRRLID